MNTPNYWKKMAALEENNRQKDNLRITYMHTEDVEYKASITADLNNTENKASVTADLNDAEKKASITIDRNDTEDKDFIATDLADSENNVPTITDSENNENKVSLNIGLGDIVDADEFKPERKKLHILLRIPAFVLVTALISILVALVFLLSICSLGGCIAVMISGVITGSFGIVSIGGHTYSALIGIAAALFSISLSVLLFVAWLNTTFKLLPFTAGRYVVICKKLRLIK